MNPNSAPGPDGLGPGFYKVAWLTVKSDIMTFLEAFHDGTTQLESINRAHIVLLPKKEGAMALETSAQYLYRTALSRYSPRS